MADLTHADRGSPFQAPPATPYNIISFGAGVQSSTMALMAAKGLIGPMPDAAIFADVQSEPQSVYTWLDYIEKQLPFPVIRITKGCLEKDALVVKEYRKRPGEYWVKSLIPAFIKNPDGSKGIVGRSCTAMYKVEQIIKATRQAAKIKRGQKHVTVTQWIGISYDEMQRMKQPSTAWTFHRWPLVELKMTRQDCLDWMAANGYPKPPRSSCVFCPYHSNKEWIRLRDEEPAEFARAVEFERQMHAANARTVNLRGVPYLHATLKPLDQVNLEAGAADPKQRNFDFNQECEGMCGV